MKLLFSFFALLLSLSAFSQAQSPLYRQVKDLLIDDDYVIGQERFSNIAQGGSFTNSFTFFAGTTYMIAAVSDDEDVTDVDLAVLYSDGSACVEDKDASRIAEVTFTPSFTRTLKVLVTNYRSDDPYYASRCRFVIGYKGASYSSNYR